MQKSEVPPSTPLATSPCYALALSDVEKSANPQVRNVKGEKFRYIISPHPTPEQDAQDPNLHPELFRLNVKKDSRVKRV